ncbi:MAG: DUF362 domain-containing protein [Bacteroidota bacterium]|nr:DUF362 domain-containing protein [Bacteroidota bacterium]
MKKINHFQREKRWFINKRNTWRYSMIIIGVLSTIWFLIRVIPKPSRASYPCMQVAAPFASSLILYITAMLASLFTYRKLRKNWLNKNYTFASIFLVFLLISWGFWMVQPFNFEAGANPAQYLKSQAPNEPIGEARGINPGRVVWVWNPDATNENCSNQAGDYWWQDGNTDQTVVDQMLSDAIQHLTEESSDSSAWDELFKHYNVTHGLGISGYTPGEKIVVKVNICSGGWGNVDEETYEKINWIGMIDTSPHLILALLDQLVNIFGVAQEDIYLGDPTRLFFDHYWDMCQGAFPNVHYLDWLGKLGRYKVVSTQNPVMFYSDGTQNDKLPESYVDASYMINIGCLKQHDCAGVTFCAKNHFGSMCRLWATHLHYALPSPTANGFENLGYGKYRNLVDLMQHKDLGEKTFLFIIDGLWGGDLPVCDPLKWQSSPFNNDWPSSIMISQDHVAIESVGTDFVMAEFDEYSTMLGSDDFLHQAADSANWADSIMYDPDGDGVYIASLGVHEHWNNNIEKLYSRNLGTGDGIELVQLLMTGVDDQLELDEDLLIVYPNPAVGSLNVRYRIQDAGYRMIEIFSISGVKIDELINEVKMPGEYELEVDVSDLAPGLYFVKIQVGKVSAVKRLVIR